MAVSGHVLFEFVPVEEMFNVAEAIVRVYHANGDYQHKARNRMKFLMKSMGWEKWRAAFDQALAEVRAEGGVPLPFDPDSPPVETAPEWKRPDPPTTVEIAMRVNAGATHGPAFTRRRRRPRRSTRSRTRDGGTPTCTRRSRTATSPRW
jgi:hypothetical protein